MYRYNVKYQIATYSGEIEVSFDTEEEPTQEEIWHRVKRLLSRGTPLPYGYQSFKIEEM